MKDNEFKSAFGSGMMKEHLILCRAIGIEHLILVANKMDLIDWDEKECKKKVIQVTKYVVKTLNWPKENLHVVPISAFEGSGLIDTNGIPSWYKGKSFLETLDEMSNVNNERTITVEGDKGAAEMEADRFVCEITNIGTANTSIIGGIVNDQDEVDGNTNSIISPGFLCMGHFNGIESEVRVEKISSKYKRPFLRTSEKGKLIVTTRKKERVSVGMRIILRKNNHTVAFGKITKSFF
jgi:translation elongation factor EF-1alpha